MLLWWTWRLQLNPEAPPLGPDPMMSLHLALSQSFCHALALRVHAPGFASSRHSLSSPRTSADSTAGALRDHSPRRCRFHRIRHPSRSPCRDRLRGISTAALSHSRCCRQPSDRDHTHSRQPSLKLHSVQSQLIPSQHTDQCSTGQTCSRM